MGYRTVIVLNNDYLSDYRQMGGPFWELIDNNMVYGELRYARGVTVHPSRHADDDGLYCMHNGQLHNIASFHFRESEIEENPDCAMTIIKRAEAILNYAKKRYQEKHGKKAKK